MEKPAGPSNARRKAAGLKSAALPIDRLLDLEQRVMARIADAEKRLAKLEAKIEKLTLKELNGSMRNAEARVRKIVREAQRTHYEVTRKHVMKAMRDAK